MKLLGVLLTIGACFKIGFSMSLALKRRAGELSGFITAFEIIRSEIVFRRAPVTVVLGEVSKGTGGTAKEFFSAVKERMDKGETFRNSCLKCREIIQNSPLSDDDTDRIFFALSAVGSSGTEEQSEKLKASVAEMDEQRTKIRSLFEKNGRLYSAIGLTAGVILAMAVI